MRVALFPTCIVDLLWGKVGTATLHILEKLGLQPEIPEKGFCCGQIAFNMGQVKEAQDYARRWWNTYRSYDLAVSPSGSCVAMIRQHYPELLGIPLGNKEGLPALGHVAVVELTEFLHRTGLGEKLRPRFPARVTYHASCHYLRGLGREEDAVALLKRVQGLTLVRSSRETLCCGFGGLFSLKYPDLSAAMGLRKIESIEATGAEYLTSTDASCLTHLGGLLRKRGSPIQPIHIAEILAHE